MPTLKKSIKEVRDQLKEAERQQMLRLPQDLRFGDDRMRGKLEGLRLAQRIIDRVFPQ